MTTEDNGAPGAPIDCRARRGRRLEGIQGAATYRSDPGRELFFADEPMTLAPHPNSGYLRIAAAQDSPPRPWRL